MTLALSGGGTRAAAFSYGVLKAMRDIEISIDGRLTALADEVSTYFDKDTRKCVHFVDGGITDNLGLLAGFDIVEAAGGPKAFLQGIHLAKTATRYVMWISVDAATNPEIKMDGTTETPSLLETVAATSDAQLHR